MSSPLLASADGLPSATRCSQRNRRQTAPQVAHKPLENERISERGGSLAVTAFPRDFRREAAGNRAGSAGFPSDPTPLDTQNLGSPLPPRRERLQSPLSIGPPLIPAQSWAFLKHEP